mgnify:CR=1 FL=1
MTDWTTPRTWQTGDLVTADDLNGELRDRMLWLHSRRSEEHTSELQSQR